MFLKSGVPDPNFEFYRGIRTVEEMMNQMQIWSVWIKFVGVSGDYPVWKRFAVKVLSYVINRSFLQNNVRFPEAIKS